MPPSRCLHFSHGLIASFQLCAISSLPSLCTIHHCRCYSHLVHVVFQLCWYVLVAHYPSIFRFDQAIFTLLLTSFSAPPLASNNEPRYVNVFTVHFFFLNVDSFVFLWTWHVLCFLLCLLFVCGTQMYTASFIAVTQHLLYYVHKLTGQP